MGRKRKNHNNKHTSSGGGGAHQKKKAKHDRFWVEDCPETSRESFHGCDVQLLITRVELLHSSTINHGGEDAAYSCAAAAATTEPTNPSAASSASSEGALKQDITPEIKAKMSSEAMKAVEQEGLVAEETSKQPEHDEISSSKGMAVKKGSRKCSPSDGGDDDDGKESVPKDDADKEVQEKKSITIGIQRHASARGPIQRRPFNQTPFFHLPHGDCGDGILNPHPKSIVADKYWAQRKHLFARYDQGVLLDPEGWYSVTPETIANHIAQRMVVGCNNNHGDDSPIVNNNGATRSTLLETGEHEHHDDEQKKEEPKKKKKNPSAGMIVLDAFAGVGGNSIAFARRPEVDLVVCVDTNDTRLRMAANNCRVYNIPTEKVVFIHGDVTQVLAVYEKGKKKLQCQQQQQEPSTMEAEISSVHNPKDEMVHGYKYGGMELLPDRLDAIFLSPPWGGRDYGDVGRRNYDLECIHLVPPPPPPSTTTTTTTDALLDGASTVHGADVNRLPVINGKDLLVLAAKAVVVKTRNVTYFLPRNTNGKSVAQSAFTVPGIRFLEMEQNYLNYKLKTITIYASSKSSQK